MEENIGPVPLTKLPLVFWYISSLYFLNSVFTYPSTHMIFHLDHINYL